MGSEMCIRDRSKTTVYNTLKLFVEHGAALMLTIDEKNACFDSETSLHAHFLCKKCGKIYDLPFSGETKQVELTCDQNGQQLVVTVEDHGVGIEDLEQALQPFFTTKPELERSGMGFSFMEAFMDRIEVRSKKGEGTRVVMWKYIEREREQ